MSIRDLDYFRRRAAQERDSAERTDDRIARRLHQELAERYKLRIHETKAILLRQQAQA